MEPLPKVLEGKNAHVFFKRDNDYRIDNTNGSAQYMSWWRKIGIYELSNDSIRKAEAKMAGRLMPCDPASQYSTPARPNSSNS